MSDARPLKVVSGDKKDVSQRMEKVALWNPDGTPFTGGGGGGVSSYIVGSALNKNVLGTNDYLYLDGSEGNVDIVGFTPGEGQSIDLPAGVYSSSWQIGFDIAADDGVGDVNRMFRVELQPSGKQLEIAWVKPAGGWADLNPYIMENLAFNFVLEAPQEMIVVFDGSTADDNGVSYYLSFALYKLGDLPE